MKKIINLILAGLVLTGIHSCEKESASLVTKTTSVSMGAGYANDIYYRFSDGLTTSVPRTNWDIAFSVPSREAAILINSTSGVTLKVYPSSTGWSTPVNMAGYDSWPALNNSDTTWMEGAFNMNGTGHPNYGWGIYDMVSHNLSGSALYIIKTRSGAMKKIFIDKKFSADQKYTFRYADTDGSNEKVVNLILAGRNKNFVYYSLDTNTEIDREPETDKWDIVFTKYIDLKQNYTVTGVLHNIGSSAQESTDTDPLSTVMPSTGYLTDISTIGADWKSFSMATNQYSIDETRVFHLKDKNNAIYRLKFKSFEGSSTGNLSFDVTTLQ